MRNLLTVLGLVLTVSPAFAAPPAVLLDCPKLRISQVDFSDCWLKHKPGQKELDMGAVTQLSEGKFLKYPKCWAEIADEKSSLKLYSVEPIGKFECAPFGLNQYCLSPEMHIEVRSPPCTGTAMDPKCSFRILPAIPAVESNVFYDPRYQCACSKNGCGHLIHTFEKAKPKAEELRAAIKAIIPGCDDVTVHDVTNGSGVSSFAISSMKCPILKPSSVHLLSCPKGSKAVRRLHLGKECTSGSIFAIACLFDLKMAADPDRDTCGLLAAKGKKGSRTPAGFE